MRGSLLIMRAVVAALGVSLLLAPPVYAIDPGREIIDTGRTIGDQRTSSPITIRHLVVHDGAVSALLVNNSTRLVRKVRLLIRHNWLWNSELKPGEANPGRSGYYTVKDEIPPEISVKFQYQPDPPLPVRSDGHFQTTVEVVGYEEVGE